MAESIFAKSNQDADDEESDQDEKLDHIASEKLLSKKRIKPKKSSAAKNKLDPSKFVVNFILCNLKRSDRPPDELPSMHFHMMNGYTTRQNDFVDVCTNAHGDIYNPMQLCILAAKARSLGEERLLNSIKPILNKYRVEIEAELRKRGKGMQPPPHIVMNKVLGQLPEY